MLKSGVHRMQKGRNGLRTPYTPSPGKERNWSTHVDNPNETGYECGYVKRCNAVAENAEPLEEGSGEIM